jgi:hypothetical protein
MTRPTSHSCSQQQNLTGDCADKECNSDSRHFVVQGFKATLG